MPTASSTLPSESPVSEDFQEPHYSALQISDSKEGESTGSDTEGESSEGGSRADSDNRFDLEAFKNYTNH